MRGRGRGRGRAARGRRGGITRGRGKKNMKVIESDEEESPQSETQQQASESTGSQQTPITQPETQQNSQPDEQAPTQDENLPPTIDLEADISQLEAPTFTTLNRGPPEPMLHLRWDHKVSLIGEKVLNPMIHSCDQCNKPILIYGRMIPCKHVFCLSCARKEDKACPRCMDPVSRVEQTNLGTVFMCTHGGSRYGSTGCRRTYLSQRDLQAHINHRHSVTGGDASPKVSGVPAQPTPQPQQQTQQQPPPRKIIPPSTPPNDPRAESGVGYRAPPRTNLITVPIQQEPPPPPPPPPQQPTYHPQSSGVTPNSGGYRAPPPPPPPPVQYGASGYPSGYYQPAPPASYPPPQYPPPPPPDQPPQQYWQHPPPMHQFYR